MCKDKTYNGWSNYETWCVSMWIDNDEYLYNQFNDFNYDADNLIELTENIKTEIKDTNFPLDGSSLYSDLLNNSLDNVNWEEIAENILEDNNEEEEEDEEEDELEEEEK